jgi:hypothetical protein
LALSLNILQALKAKEAKMDEEMSKLETMDEDDFEVLREKRKAAMQKAAGVRQKNLLNGHGRYTELSDQQEFFDASKNSKLVKSSAASKRIQTSICGVPFEASARERAITASVCVGGAWGCAVGVLHGGPCCLAHFFKPTRPHFAALPVSPLGVRPFHALTDCGAFLPSGNVALSSN